MWAIFCITFKGVTPCNIEPIFNAGVYKEDALQALTADCRAADALQHCVDTDSWTSGKGMDCGKYASLGYCINGSVPDNRKWAIGALFGWPEKACSHACTMKCAYAHMRMHTHEFDAELLRMWQEALQQQA